MTVSFGDSAVIKSVFGVVFLIGVAALIFDNFCVMEVDRDTSSFGSFADTTRRFVFFFGFFFSGFEVEGSVADSSRSVSDALLGF